MDREEEIEQAPGRPPADDGAASDLPVDPDSENRVRRVRPPARQDREAALHGPTAPQRPFKEPASALARRIPSYPAWEKPPSPYNYPRLRGHEEHRTVKPLVFVAIAVAVVLGALVVLPALLGHPNNAPAASRSATAPTASNSVHSSAPSNAAVASATAGGGGTVAPFVSYQQYKVVAGDSVAKIAAKFHLKQWELLLANPKLADNPTLLQIGLVLNIPQPGQLTPAPPATPTPIPTPTPSATPAG